MEKPLARCLVEQAGGLQEAGPGLICLSGLDGHLDVLYRGAKGRPGHAVPKFPGCGLPDALLCRLVVSQTFPPVQKGLEARETSRRLIKLKSTETAPVVKGGCMLGLSDPGEEKKHRPLRIGLDIRPLQSRSRYQGTGVYCQNLLKAFAAMDGKETFLLLHNRRSALPFDLPRCPRFGLWPVWRPYEIGQRFLPLLDPVWTPFDLRRALPDVHHATSIHSACLWRPCPVVVTVPDVIPLVFPDQYLQSGMKHRLLYALARRTDHVVTVSEYSRRDIHRLLNIPLDRITVTLEAADPLFRPLEKPAESERVVRRYGVVPPYILYVGGFTIRDPRKRVLLLLEAYQILRNRGFERYQLVLAGKEGPYSDLLKAQMSERGWSAGVLFTDYVADADLPHLYNRASCFVFPSAYEGFGLPPLEAISCGTPTIAYRNSSLPEVLGEGAILLDTEGPAELAEAMEAVLTRRDLAQELREKGLAQARKFTWQRCAEKTLEAYRACAGRRRSRLQM